MTIKAYLNIHISKWYDDAEEDYGVHGRFIDAITDGSYLKILWEEEGKLYKMEFNWYTMYSYEDIYNIWMESEWEEA